MMLPPIHKQASASGSANELSKRREPYGDRAEGDPTTGGRDRSLHTERLQALERENAQIRDEMQHLRQLLSNNQHSQNDQIELSEVSDEMQRAVHAFNAKAQADVLWQQREQQKATLLFAEVARLGQAFESLGLTVRTLGDDNRRRIDQHDQQLAQLVSLSATFGGSRPSPTKQSLEFYRQNEELQWIKQALSQVRSELEADRAERWKADSERSQGVADLRAVVVKTEATIDARIATHLERVHSKLVTDKMEIARTLDQYREFMTGADFKRMSSQVVEFSRLNDHLHALERWIHGEHGKIKRVLQSIPSEYENQLQVVVAECAAIVRLWSSTLQQQDDDWRAQMGVFQEAVAEMATHVQRKVFALEQVVPLEVKARQTQDDKLRLRLESTIQSLARSIKATREDAMAAVAAVRLSVADPTAAAGVAMLESRIDALEQAHEATLRRVEEAQAAMTEKKEEVQSTPVERPSDPSPLIVPSAVDLELAEAKMVELKQHVTELLQPFVDELAGRQNELLARLESFEGDQGDAISSLQRWSATHAQECRQCYEYTQWTLEQALTQVAVQQTVDRLVDSVLCLAREAKD